MSINFKAIEIFIKEKYTIDNLGNVYDINGKLRSKYFSKSFILRYNGSRYNINKANLQILKNIKDINIIKNNKYIIYYLDGNKNNISYSNINFKIISLKKCKNCSIETENSKFCSRSCSATYNNKNSNKRRGHYKYNWDDENKFKDDVLNSKSISDFFDLVNLSPSGLAYKKFKNNIIKFNINTNHYNGGCIINSKTSSKYKDRIIFNSPQDIIDNMKTSSTVREFIIKCNVIEYKCSKCNLSNKWMGENITLQLDHIDGNRKNNNLENLRFLCPNCHSQTPTWGSKKIKEYKSCTQCYNFINLKGRKTCSDTCLKITYKNPRKK